MEKLEQELLRANDEIALNKSFITGLLAENNTLLKANARLSNESQLNAPIKREFEEYKAQAEKEMELQKQIIHELLHKNSVLEMKNSALVSVPTVSKTNNKTKK